MYSKPPILRRVGSPYFTAAVSDRLGRKDTAAAHLERDSGLVTEREFKKSGFNLFKKSDYVNSWDGNWNRTLGALPSKFVLFSERLLVGELQENTPLEHLLHLEHAAFGL